MEYRIHGDGSFDFIGEHISLHGCYPAVDGFPLRPVRVAVTERTILFFLQNGSIELGFTTYPDGRLALACKAENLGSVHDIFPICAGAVSGAERIFVQGFGMEGPSGCFSLQDSPPVSSGLTALFRVEDVLLVYAEDHTRYRSVFCKEKASAVDYYGGVRFSAGLILEVTAGAFVELPVLYLEEGKGLAASLRRCAQRIAASMGARHAAPPAFFWSSWYHAYETMDQQTLEATLSGIKACEVPFRHLELDAGYCTSLGDWLCPNHRWPGGLKKAAETIRDAGLLPGIWIAPFIVGDRSSLCREHPDWLLHDRDGKLHIQLRSYTEPKMWGNPDCNYYVLDTSHPAALAYITDVFRTFRQWGFRFFKTDFLLWNMQDSACVKRHQPGLSSVEILRNTFFSIREAVGDDSYLLGCIAPFMPLIGLVDGMRLAGDCGAQWREPFGPVNMLQELPCDNYFNHVFWQNDPDAVLLRDFDTMLSPDEVWSLALLQALSGGAVSTSDPIRHLGEDRKQLLRLIRPAQAVTPELPYFGTKRPELLLTHRLRQGNILFVMNQTDAPLPVYLRLSELFGERFRYQYRYSRTEGVSAESVENDFFFDCLAPHTSALIFVTEKPLRERPENLWNW